MLIFIKIRVTSLANDVSRRFWSFRRLSFSIRLCHSFGTANNWSLLESRDFTGFRQRYNSLTLQSPIEAPKDDFKSRNCVCLHLKKTNCQFHRFSTNTLTLNERKFSVISSKMEKKWFQNLNWMEIAFDRLQALGREGKWRKMAKSRNSPPLSTMCWFYYFNWKVSRACRSTLGADERCRGRSASESFKQRFTQQQHWWTLD